MRKIRVKIFVFWEPSLGYLLKTALDSDTWKHSILICTYEGVGDQLFSLFVSYRFHIDFFCIKTKSDLQAKLFLQWLWMISTTGLINGQRPEKKIIYVRGRENIKRSTL